MEHLQALEQQAERTDTHKTQTTSLSLTETWCRVIWEGTGKLVSGFMDSKPRMPLVLSRTQSLLE